MPQRYSILLEIAAPKDYPAWMRRLQEAFTPAAAQYYGVCEPVPSEESVRHSLHAAGADVYHIVLDGRRRGHRRSHDGPQHAGVVLPCAGLSRPRDRACRMARNRSALSAYGRMADHHALF